MGKINGINMLFIMIASFLLTDKICAQTSITIEEKVKQEMMYGLDFSNLDNCNISSAEYKSLAKYTILECQTSFIKLPINPASEVGNGCYDWDIYSKQLEFIERLRFRFSNVKFLLSPTYMPKLDPQKCGEFLARQVKFFRTKLVRVPYLEINGDYSKDELSKIIETTNQMLAKRPEGIREYVLKELSEPVKIFGKNVGDLGVKINNFNGFNASGKELMKNIGTLFSGIQKGDACIVLTDPLGNASSNSILKNINGKIEIGNGYFIFRIFANSTEGAKYMETKCSDPSLPVVAFFGNTSVNLWILNDSEKEIKDLSINYRGTPFNLRKVNTIKWILNGNPEGIEINHERKGVVIGSLNLEPYSLYYIQLDLKKKMPNIGEVNTVEKKIRVGSDVVADEGIGGEAIIPSEMKKKTPTPKSEKKPKRKGITTEIK